MENWDNLSSAVVGRVPPNDQQAEEAVLRQILLHPEYASDAIAKLTPEHFYFPLYQEMFRAIISLESKGESPGLLEVGNALKGKRVFEDNGAYTYLAELIDGLGVSFDAGIKIIQKNHTRRQAILSGIRMVDLMYQSNHDPAEVIGEAGEELYRLTEERSDVIEHASSVSERAFADIQRKRESRSIITGVGTGYNDIDRITAGWQPSDLILIAARPSVGKTAFALNTATRSAVKWGVPTVFYSLEMRKESLLQRQMCAISHVDFQAVRTGRITDREEALLLQARNIIDDAPIYIDDTPALTTAEFRSRTRRMVRRYGIGLVVVDYLQLMRSSVKVQSREQEIAEISRTLKGEAKNHNIPVIALSQLNRKIEDRTDPRPMLSDLRESGSLEQDADVVAFVHRDKDSDDGTGQTAEIIFGKQRNGPCGMVNLTWIGNSVAFENHKPTP